jgi:DNA modification methylase
MEERLLVNQIICADCLDVLKSLPDKCVDCVITDPPYGINYTRHIENAKFRAIANDSELSLKWMPEAGRVLKWDSLLVVFHRWDVAEKFRTAIMSAGLKVRSQIVWAKGGGGLADTKVCFSPEHELAWFATRGEYSFPNCRPSSVLNFPKVNPNLMVHPTEKPVEMFTHLIKRLTKPTDLILDPFCGSGTTCVAAELLGRKWIGIELDPTYAAIARKRVKEAQEQFALLEGVK